MKFHHPLNKTDLFLCIPHCHQAGFGLSVVGTLLAAARGGAKVAVGLTKRHFLVGFAGLPLTMACASSMMSKKKLLH